MMMKQGWVFEDQMFLMHPSIFRFTVPPPGNPRAFTQKCVPTVGPSQQNGLTPGISLLNRARPPGFSLSSKILIDEFVAKNEK